MDPVQELLEHLQAGDLSEEQFAEALAALSDEQLAEFETVASETFDGIRAGEVEIEGEPLVLLERIVDAVEATRSEAANRLSSAEAAQAAADALEDRLRPAAETDPAGGDGDVPAGGEGDTTETEPAEGDNTPAGDEPVGDGEPTADAEPEPVAAAASPRRPALPRIGRVAARRPAARAPRPSTDAPRSVITAAADVPGFSAGQEIPGREQLAEAIVRRAEALRRVSIPEGGEVSLHVATIRADYPEAQDLRSVGHDPRAVEQAITAALGQNNSELVSMTAAGGICAPPTPLYDQISIADDGRPARQALPSFQADRGGITFMPPPVWTDFTAGVRKWETDRDVEALTNSNVRKPCVRVDCDDAVTEEIYGIPVCVTVGNFYARTFDERVQAILDGVGAWQARFAERELLDKIGSESTSVSTEQTLGSTRDVLATLDRAIAGFRSRHRVADAFRLDFWAPRWLRDNMRADLVRSLPASGATLDEQLAVADATLDAFFARRMVNVTWLWDGENSTDQEFGAEAGGSLQNWPTRAITYLFHPGAWLFLDGGVLDLGVVRDSTLNASNDLQIWSESFEGLAFRGLESLRIDMNICPSGEVSGTTDVTPLLCSTGS
jgi:hypothetical protein